MVALVTGASSGIGKEIAILLSKMGYDLILVARREEKLKELASTLKTNCKVISLDLSVAENAEKLYEQTKNDGVEVLVNNAGFGTFGEFIKTPLEKEISMINTNIVSLHILTKLFCRDFAEKNNGYILNVGSSAGFMAGPLLSAYYASKAYVLRLSEAVAEEVKGKGVKVSVLCPGPVETEFDLVANVKFSLKGVTARFVAKKAVDGMFKGKRVIIPGIKMKLAIFFVRFLPDGLMVKITHKMQKKKG